MLTPAPGKPMSTSPRESDVDAHSGETDVNVTPGNLMLTPNPKNPAFKELSYKQCPTRWIVQNWVNELFAIKYSAKNLWYIGKKPELKSKREHAVRQRLYFEELFTFTLEKKVRRTQLATSELFLLATNPRRTNTEPGLNKKND